MPTAILMPRPGQMTEECTVQAWLKREGDIVRRGDVLFEIETDKSTMEVEAFEEGTLLRIVVPAGATVAVNSVVAWVGEPGAAIPVDAPVASEPAPAEAATARATIRPNAAAPATPSQGARMAVSPRAGRLAAELGVDTRALVGSGPGGRIVERDVRAAAGGAARAAAGGAAVASPATMAGEAPPEPLSRLRQVIARRLTESVSTIPHFSVTVAVDMTGLVALRAELRGGGSPIGLTDIIHAATIQALVEFPLLNARTDGRSVWMRDQVHLGVAVSVPGGLLVPVVRGAQSLGLAELHDRTAALVEGARAGRLGPDELTGSTFTVSNMGMFGVREFTAIINPGESGILAVAGIEPTAVAIGDTVAVRQIMRVTLSADHRIVDGELAARFLDGLRRRLQDVDEMRRWTGR